ncbi:MAG TPA: hypothetical protein VET87_14785 [Rubrivivax sp.]|nr:hypothetical protein [Rubrivivax sp.]
MATPLPAGLVVHRRHSKASLRERSGFLGLPNASGFAADAVAFDGREHKGACRALHLRGLESTENPAGIGVANGENKHSLNGETELATPMAASERHRLFEGPHWASV